MKKKQRRCVWTIDADNFDFEGFIEILKDRKWMAIAELMILNQRLQNQINNLYKKVNGLMRQKRGRK